MRPQTKEERLLSARVLAAYFAKELKKAQSLEDASVLKKKIEFCKSEQARMSFSIGMRL